MVTRSEKRLAGWKRAILSKGGRLMFIKNALGDLLIYYVSLDYSGGCCEEVESYSI